MPFFSTTMDEIQSDCSVTGAMMPCFSISSSFALAFFSVLLALFLEYAGLELLQDLFADAHSLEVYLIREIHHCIYPRLLQLNLR